MENKGLWAGLVAVALVAVIALVLAMQPAELVVDNDGTYGGTTNLDSLTLSGTLSAEQITTTDDMTVTDDLNVQGTVMQIGSDSVTSYVYVGTTDGCGAWTFTASGTTPTLTATSSAFCN